MDERYRQVTSNSMMRGVAGLDHTLVKNDTSEREEEGVIVEKCTTDKPQGMDGFSFDM